MNIHDYLLDHRGLDWPSLLQEWAWLVPPKFTLWMVNRFGDLFIVLDDGSVHMLDVGCGTLEKLADSRDGFGDVIDDSDHANQWLMIPLVNHLVATGITLTPGQCYGCKTPPILGGHYTVENTCVLPIADYYGAYGSIHRQLKDLPDGAKVVIRTKT